MSQTPATPGNAGAPAAETTAPYGTGVQAAPQRRVRIPHLTQLKATGHKWAMLTLSLIHISEPTRPY